MEQNHAPTPQQLALSNNYQRVMFRQQQQQLEQQQQQQQQQLSHQNKNGHNTDTSFTPNNFASSTRQPQGNPPGTSDIQEYLQQNLALLQAQSAQVFRGGIGGGDGQLQPTTAQEIQDHQASAGDSGANVMDQYRQLLGSVNTDVHQQGTNHLMLQTKVEAFSRDSNHSSDSFDLWKVFDDDVPLKQGSMPVVQRLLSSQLQPSQQMLYQQRSTDNSQRGPIPPTTGIQGSAISTNISGFPQMVEAQSRNHTAMGKSPERQAYQSHQIESSSEPFLLPSTMIPPSVLALSSTPSFEAHRKRGQESEKQNDAKRKRSISQPLVKPQDYLETLLKRQGISSFQRILSDDAEYDAVPSALQLASFGTQLVKAVHTGDVEQLSQLLECGLSPNPCNQFRDSIVDLVCKRANNCIFECLVRHGCDLQVVDGFGRTPLHHACWASTFSAPIVESILERDPVQFCIEDKHGQTPLEYVRSELMSEWNDFLEQRVGGHLQSPPTLKSPKERRPEGTLVDPSSALSVSLAALVSSGVISPAQISQMDDETRRTYKPKCNTL